MSTRLSQTGSARSLRTILIAVVVLSMLGTVNVLFPAVAVADPCGDGFPAPNLQSTATHPGDLVLSGNDTLVIENQRYVVEGNVYLSGSARLDLRNAELVVQHYPRQEIIFTEGATFSAVNSIISGFIHSHFGDHSILEADRVFMINLINVGGQAQATIQNSCLFEDRFGLVQVGGQANIYVADSVIGAIGLEIPSSVPVVIDGLVSGYFEHWEAATDISPSLEYSLVLDRTTVKENPGYSGGYEMGWNIFTMSDAELTISGSVLNKLVITFGGEDVQFSGLARETPVDLDFRDIHLVGTTIQGQWGIFVSNGETRIYDSDGVWLWPVGNRDTIIDNTFINEFDPRQYTGTIRLTDSSMTNGFEIFESSVFRMEGSVRMLDISPLFTTDSRMTRHYQVEVIDAATGLPFSGVNLTLARGSEAEWNGTTDNDGQTSFEVTFDVDNYEDIWTLSSPNPEIQINHDISIRSDTPVRINLTPSPDGGGWIPIMEVDCRLATNGDGSAASPHNSILEGIKNVGYRGIVQIAPGTCTEEVVLRSGVVVEGSGAESTLISGNVFAEQIDGASLRSVTVVDDDTAGIHCYDSSLAITNLIIRDQPHNGIHSSNCIITARNNTLTGNGHNGILLIDGSMATIENNIFASNGEYGVGGTEWTAVINYNNFWLNGLGPYGSAFGEGVGNLFLDPRFVTPNDFRFRLDSPCINAGNPNPDFNNPDGTRNTMGAFGGPYSLVEAVADTDSDGVLDVNDVCPGTVLPDMAPELKINRYSVNEAGEFVSDGKAAPIYTIAETGGCSPRQIVEEAELGVGHLRFGLSRSALEAWIAELGM